MILCFEQDCVWWQCREHRKVGSGTRLDPKKGTHLTLASLNTKRRKRVLLVSNHTDAARNLERGSGLVGVDVRRVPDAVAAEESAHAWAADVVVLDLSSGSRGDLALIRRLKDRDPESEVIVVGGCDEVMPASEVLKAGAWWWPMGSARATAWRRSSRVPSRNADFAMRISPSSRSCTDGNSSSTSSAEAGGCRISSI